MMIENKQVTGMEWSRQEADALVAKQRESNGVGWSQSRVTGGLSITRMLEQCWNPASEIASRLLC